MSHEPSFTWSPDRVFASSFFMGPEFTKITGWKIRTTGNIPHTIRLNCVVAVKHWEIHFVSFPGRRFSIAFHNFRLRFRCRQLSWLLNLMMHHSDDGVKDATTRGWCSRTEREFFQLGISKFVQGCAKSISNKNHSGTFLKFVFQLQHIVLYFVTRNG